MTVEGGDLEKVPQEESSSTLAKTVQELGNELAESQRIADEDKDNLNETIRSLRAELQLRETSSSAFIFNRFTLHRPAFVLSTDKKVTSLEKTAQGLRNQLVDSNHAANKREKSYDEIVNSLRVRLRERDDHSSAPIYCSGSRSIGIHFH